MIFEHEVWERDKAYPERLHIARKPRIRYKAKREQIIANIERWNRNYERGRKLGINPHLPHLIDTFGGIVPFCLAIHRTPDHIIHSFFRIKKDGMRSKVRVNPREVFISPRTARRLVYVARSFGILLKPSDVWPEMISEDGLFRNPHTDTIMRDWLTDYLGKIDRPLANFEEQIAELLE